MMDYDDYQEKMDTQYYRNRSEEAETRLALAQEFLEKLIKNLYGPNVLHVEQLEDCLENLCHNLEVEFPAASGLPIIGKKLVGV